jgi:transaldolase
MAKLDQSKTLDGAIDEREVLRSMNIAQQPRRRARGGGSDLEFHQLGPRHGYDESLRRPLGDSVVDPQDLVYAAAFEDLGEAATLLRPRWEATSGQDGYVSVEVPPDLTLDTPAFARRLHEHAGFPNLLVKIPDTPQGLTAMEEAVTAGIGVNVTLLFSDTHYLQAA